MFPPEQYKTALETEFALSYYGKLGSVASWQDIPVGERDWHYHKLASVRAEEKKERDEAEAKMAAEAAQAKARSKHK